ncbi:ABC transporter substrate-binding protein [Enemella dayhoffiae]|uniref:ABC transporter substrate-binding protein n=1 Tax=Enemella dayhoffiae TaxID=2016507 RepID=A0A255GZ10_9ACTN|nr:ABC transporter substrate-binding protein [Enemella dayhoffiae]OYO20838.1 ABC transporter substrate-binding protein [Enemella dayhoffiae]
MKSCARVALAGAAVLLLTTGACSSKSPASPTTAPVDFNERGPINLVAVKDSTGQTQKELDTWNATHPNEKATLIQLPDSSDQQRNVILQAFQTKNADYTVISTDIIWTAEFAANGWITELDPAPFQLEAMVPAAVEGGKYRDKLYAVPEISQGALLYFRKDLLDAVGAQPPTTMDEVKQICAKVKTLPQGAGVDCYGGQFNKYEGLTVNFAEAVGGSGGQIVDAAGRPTVNTPQANQALLWMVGAFNDGTIPRQAVTWTEDESRQAFQNGKLVFLRNWPHVYARAAKTDGSSQVAGRFDVTTLPALPGGRTGVSSLGGANLAVSRFARNKGTAVDFIKYMTSTETMRERTVATSVAPARTAIYTDPAATSQLTYLPTLLESLQTARPRPVVVKYGDFTVAIQDQVYASLQGQKKPDQALTELQARLDALAK